MKKLIALTLLALLATSCLPQDARVPQSPLLPLLERKSGLIAYVGIDGNLYVSDQAGGHLTQLTDDASISGSQNSSVRYYQFPAWSKDSSQLAFVEMNVEGGTTGSTLYVHDLNAETTNEVYTSTSEFPFYLNWSPDNANVGFITTTAAQDNIIMQSVPSAGGERRIIDVGSPYYWSWAPDGSVMVVNSGSGNSSMPQHLSFLRLGAEVIEYGLDIQPASFQAPAWSPDGSRIALTRSTGDENQIIVTDAAGENPEVIGTFRTKTAFAWSFDGTKLAYLDGLQALSDGTVGALHVYDMETSEEIVENKNVVAFFWSPNSEKLAYYLLVPVTDPSGGSSGDAAQGQQQYGLQLFVLDMKTGESRDLFTYRPTEPFLNILPYFDQYHQSVTIWSPDNNNLVLSFLDGEGNPGIAIVAASGQLEPRLLANGYIAFWSWE